MVRSFLPSSQEKEKRLDNFYRDFAEQEGVPEREAALLYWSILSLSLEKTKLLHIPLNGAGKLTMEHFVDCGEFQNFVSLHKFDIIQRFEQHAQKLSGLNGDVIAELIDACQDHSTLLSNINNRMKREPATLSGQDPRPRTPNSKR